MTHCTVYVDVKFIEKDSLQYTSTVQGVPSMTCKREECRPHPGVEKSTGSACLHVFR